MLPEGMPYRREESAPVLDLTDPCEIWRYFDDSEFLFEKYSISVCQEKEAAVYYSSVAVETLWKTVPTFSDPGDLYEEFQAEIIAFYTGVQACSWTLRDSWRTVCARQFSQGRSSESIIPDSSSPHMPLSQRTASARNASILLLAILEPNLAAFLRTRLKDPYTVKSIYDATLHTLAW